ncbi:hypothetical protein QP994_00995 [Corynebacterium sp. MSK044]|uniref:hypothetical protein n=1 Tax=unclassified Corynebacterium TaxID=2624378 RepID=UPI00254A1BBA|nr:MULTISPECIES: hypothetical protein [unclassified Corynebacterium]MDK8794171.1 hypothetical protein [Corynebacterium sp. MSK041]MDK8796462.1 hypothetical protein [Corynebacterium sp. MSK044]
MCRPVPCKSCGKTTWAGCGNHVDEVKAGVAPGQWCTCPRNASAPKKQGFLSRLFG